MFMCRAQGEGADASDAADSGAARGIATDSHAARALALMRGRPYVDKVEVAEGLRLTLRRTCFLLNRMEKDGFLKCLIPNSLYCLVTDVYCPSWMGCAALSARSASPKRKAREKERR